MLITALASNGVSYTRLNPNNHLACRDFLPVPRLPCPSTRIGKIFVNFPSRTLGLLCSCSRWWIVPGVVALAVYGFVPSALLPDTSSAEFGRAFAVYGGVFITMSLAWGRVFDHFEPDIGDYVGATVALVGAGIMWWFPR